MKFIPCNCAKTKAYTYFSVRTQVLRRDLKRDTKTCLLSQLLGKVVGLAYQTISTKDVLAKLGQTSFKCLVTMKLNKNKL